MKKLFNYLSVVVLLMLCACGGATYIKPSSVSVSFPIEGGAENVNIDADGSWEVASSPAWVTTEKQDSVLVIKTERNETGKILKGDIVLNGKDGVEVSISLTQATKCTHIIPAEKTLNFDKEGGTETVKIDTDGAIQVETPDGFTASYANGVLIVTASANDGGKRSGAITLTADEQSATIDVSQKGNICSTCGGTGSIKCKKCHGLGHIDTGRDFYIGCTSCGGRDGELHYDYFSGKYENLFGYRRGSGRVKCPTCGGTGM